MKLRKLWKRWMDRVEKHNEKQTYATYEECWSGYEIFYPFLISGGAFGLGLIGGVQIRSLIIVAIVYFVVFSLFLLFNWLAYDK